MESSFWSALFLDFYLLEDLHVDSIFRLFLLDFWNF